MSTAATMPFRNSQGAHASRATAAPISMPAVARTPSIAPVASMSGLQLTPRLSAAAATPASVPPTMNPCGMTAGRPSRNQVTAPATAAAATSSTMRRTAMWRALNIVSITSPVATPVGNGSPSSTISRRRSNVATKTPSTPTAIPNGISATLEKCMPISASAGMGPITPVTKHITAADDAAVCVMLFSSAS